VIALVWFKRKVGETSGKDYLNGLFEVCGGRPRSFFTVVSCNLESEGTVARWQVWIGALGIKETFELGDTVEKTDRKGDANISRLFKGKPFVAELDIDSSGDSPRQNIKSVVFRSKWTKEEEATALAWIEGQSSSRPEDGADAPPSDDYPSTPDDPGPPPDDDFGPMNYDDMPEPRGRTQGGIAPDDDIPF
jgi:hypothetical protein